MKISHLALWTGNIEAQKIFWRDYFGGTPNELYISKNRPGFSSYFISLSEGPTIELMHLKGMAEGQHGAELTGWAHVAIDVGSRHRVDEMVIKASEDGILVSPVRLTGDGYYEAIIKEPDSNLIEIMG